MSQASFSPVWVVNPYTGERLNLEPLFRFNAQARNPLIQLTPFDRTITVLANVEMQHRERFVHGNTPSEAIVATHLNELDKLITALSQISTQAMPPSNPQRH